MTQAADRASLSVKRILSQKEKKLVTFFVKNPIGPFRQRGPQGHTKFFSAWPIRDTENSILIIS